MDYENICAAAVVLLGVLVNVGLMFYRQHYREFKVPYNLLYCKVYIIVYSIPTCLLPFIIDFLYFVCHK